jgi:hypothetical protein
MQPVGWRERQLNGKGKGTAKQLQIPTTEQKTKYGEITPKNANFSVNSFVN